MEVAFERIEYFGAFIQDSSNKKTVAAAVSNREWKLLGRVKIVLLEVLG